MLQINMQISCHKKKLCIFLFLCHFFMFIFNIFSKSGAKITSLHQDGAGEQVTAVRMVMPYYRGFRTALYIFCKPLEI